MGQINTIHKDRFNVWNASGIYITGLVKADFDILLHNQDRVEVSSTITVGITEMESGLYESDFTPPTEGIYSLKLHNPDYFPTSLLAIYEVDDSSFDTIEDKIDIMDANIDLILEDTSGLEGNLTGYMDTKTIEISGYISDHDLNMESNFATLSGIVSTSESTLSGIVNDSDQQISGYIISSEFDISGYIINSETNIRGADSDDLKIISDQIDTVQHSIYVNFKVPDTLGKPDTGTIKYIFILDIFDSNGNIEVPDSTPTFKLEYTDGSIIVAETAMTIYPIGQYYYEFDIPYDQANGVVVATAKVIENGVTKYYKQSSLIQDYIDLSLIDGKLDVIQTDIDIMEGELSRALGLMQENQKIVTLTKTVTGKMLTGTKYLYDGNNFETANIIAIYDITVTYDNNDQAIEFLSPKRD